MIRVQVNPGERIRQGDIFRDVQLIDQVSEKEGVLEVSGITFPFVIVLTQDCDLEQDGRSYIRHVSEVSQYELLMSVLVAPLYNAEHVRTGTHLDELQIVRGQINSDRWRTLKTNQMARYHYIEFPQSAKVVPLVIDFKHYFSVNLEYLRRLSQDQHITTVAELFRERISQRFANFLARIALPNVEDAE
jgi:hypothetical protein